MSISAERTVTLPEYCGATPGLSWPLIWPAKDPSDVMMDFSLNVSGWLLEIGDTIGSFTVGSAPTGDTGDLEIASAVSHNGVCTVYTNAGLPLTTYDVTFNITGETTNETLSRTVSLPVAIRYANAAAEATVSGVVQ